MKRGLFIILFVILIFITGFITGCEPAPNDICCESLNLDGTTDYCVNVNADTADEECSIKYKGSGGYNIYTNGICSRYISCNDKTFCLYEDELYLEGSRLSFEGSTNLCYNGIWQICYDCNNVKNLNKYNFDEIFLISDNNWKDVLSLVPLTTWTGGFISAKSTDCRRGEGTSENVCTYPTLIYHEDEYGFDAESIIEFMQSYNPQKITIIGNSPQELDNLLITQPDFGVGLTIDQIQRISSVDYLDYWVDYDTLVYVEDNYELALLASTYASLLNIPLIIKNGQLDNIELFNNKKIILVGSISCPIGATCNEQYNLEQLQQKYIDLTKTDKIIIVNPNDLNLRQNLYDVYANKIIDYCSLINRVRPSTNLKSVIFGKASLVSPILASAKHELILSTNSQTIPEVDSFIENKINSLFVNISIYNYLTIFANPNAIEFSNPIKIMVYGNPISSAVDSTIYADLNNDQLPDMAVGRIMGYTTSDISSYIARDLYYWKLLPNGAITNLIFMASSFAFEVNNANYWSSSFSSLYEGYNSTGKASIDYWVFEANDWENKEFISYGDHGGYGWSGIWSLMLPKLNNPFIISNSCSTCLLGGSAKSTPIIYGNSNTPTITPSDTIYSAFVCESFCLHTIRKGAIGYVGTVDTSFVTNYIFQKFFSDVTSVYGYNIGNSFKKAYDEYNSISFMTVIIGDPTLKLRFPNKFYTPLAWFGWW